VKTPICSFDARSGILCSLCENKLRSGQLTREDVEGSIRLTKLSSKNQDMDKLTLVNSRKVAEEFILFFRAADLTFLRSNEQLVTTIQKEFRGNVWFLEADCPPRRFLDNLFFPIRISNSNMIWLPDGHKVTQVTITHNDYSKISEKVDKIKQIADKIKGIELMVQVSEE
jgi:hypothetical protein